MSSQSKLWISLLVVAFDIGLVIYLATSLTDEPVIVFAVAALMVASSIHVVLTIWFGEKWYASAEFRAAIGRLIGR